MIPSDLTAVRGTKTVDAYPELLFSVYIDTRALFHVTYFISERIAPDLISIRNTVTPPVVGTTSAVVWTAFARTRCECQSDLTPRRDDIRRTDSSVSFNFLAKRLSFQRCFFRSLWNLLEPRSYTAYTMYFEWIFLRVRRPRSIFGIPRLGAILFHRDRRGLKLAFDNKHVCFAGKTRTQPSEVFLESDVHYVGTGKRL